MGGEKWDGSTVTTLVTVVVAVVETKEEKAVFVSVCVDVANTV